MNKKQEQQILNYYSTADKYIRSKTHSNAHQTVFTKESDKYQWLVLEQKSQCEVEVRQTDNHGTITARDNYELTRNLPKCVGVERLCEGTTMQIPFNADEINFIYQFGEQGKVETCAHLSAIQLQIKDGDTKQIVSDTLKKLNALSEKTCAELTATTKRRKLTERDHSIKTRLAKAKEQAKQPTVAEGKQHKTHSKRKGDIMEEIGISHHPKRKPNGITKADREARKSDDLLKRDFRAEKPLAKCITDITEIKTRDGKLYVSAIFDCFDSSVAGLAMDTNMKAPLCVQTLENAVKANPGIQGAVIHSDRGSQYTSQIYRNAICKYGIKQSMNSAGGRCHDNARCESMWARMKSELLYGRYDTEKMNTDELKTIIWRYFISYWNNRRICSANGGLPPMVKRQQYYNSLKETA